MPTYEEKLELKEKLTHLVNSRFGGDFARAFDHYDRDGDGKLTRENVLDVITDAGVGRWITRGMWADGIMEELDKDLDGKIDKLQVMQLVN